MSTTSILSQFLPDLDWEYDRRGDEVAALEIGPFTITVKKKLDDYFDWEQGKGIHNPEPGAIRHRNGDRNSYDWFLPDMTAEDHYKELARDSRWTIDEARQEASKYVMQDYRRWWTYGQEWNYVYVVVTIEYQNYEIGVASCGGIESDSDNEHFVTIAWEDMGEAINDALHELEKFKDAPSYLLVELDAKIDEAFAASYAAHMAERNEPTFHHRPFDPTNFRRPDEDIPAYVPVDEDEYRVIICPRCDYSDITDGEYCYVIGKKDEFSICRDCYYELDEMATERLNKAQQEANLYTNLTVYEIELEILEILKEEGNG